MRTRYSTSLLGLCLATVTAALLSPAAAQQWVMPRTPDGHPDLQGNWTNVTITPFQRAQNQGPVFTAEEAMRKALEGSGYSFKATSKGKNAIAQRWACSLKRDKTLKEEYGKLVGYAAKEQKRKERANKNSHRVQI